MEDNKKTTRSLKTTSTTSISSSGKKSKKEKILSEMRSMMGNQQALNVKQFNFKKGRKAIKIGKYFDSQLEPWIVELLPG